VQCVKTVEEDNKAIILCSMNNIGCKKHTRMHYLDKNRGNRQRTRRRKRENNE